MLRLKQRSAAYSNTSAHGSPKFIRSDNGPHFVNEVIRQFLILVGTSHDRTMAYSSEENALVERSYYFDVKLILNTCLNNARTYVYTYLYIMQAY